MNCTVHNEKKHRNDLKAFCPLGCSFSTNSKEVWRDEFKYKILQVALKDSDYLKEGGIDRQIDR